MIHTAPPMPSIFFRVCKVHKNKKPPAGGKSIKRNNPQRVAYFTATVEGYFAEFLGSIIG